jgi:hypothetical protein
MDITFNIAKGYEKKYAALDGGANDALIIVLLKDAVQADATLADHDTLSAVLGANTEATGAWYARKTVSSVTPTVDDTNDWYTATFANQTWTSATAGQNISALLVCYDPDTTTGTDTTVVPITKHDFAVTTNGSDLTAQLGSTGFIIVQ